MELTGKMWIGITFLRYFYTTRVSYSYLLNDQSTVLLQHRSVELLSCSNRIFETTKNALLGRWNSQQFYKKHTIKVQCYLLFYVLLHIFVHIPSSFSFITGAKLENFQIFPGFSQSVGYHFSQFGLFCRRFRNTSQYIPYDKSEVNFGETFILLQFTLQFFFKNGSSQEMFVQKFREKMISQDWTSLGNLFSVAQKTN
jgi:hypothetical protein